MNNPPTIFKFREQSKTAPIITFLYYHAKGHDISCRDRNIGTNWLAVDQQSEFACHHFFGSPSSVLSLYVKYIPNLWATSSSSKHNTVQNQDHLWSNVVSRIHNFRDFLEIVRRHLQHLNQILMTTLTYPKLLGETPYFSY